MKKFIFWDLLWLFFQNQIVLLNRSYFLANRAVVRVKCLKILRILKKNKNLNFPLYVLQLQRSAWFQVEDEVSLHLRQYSLITLFCANKVIKPLLIFDNICSIWFSWFKVFYRPRKKQCCPWKSRLKNRSILRIKLLIFLMRNGFYLF